MALCAWNSRPPTANVTSLNFSLSNKFPKSSESLHSGTLNWTMLLWPEMLTLSATTLTSQNIVNLSSGRSPLASSNRKSLRINFLKPQSFPCTKRYALEKGRKHLSWKKGDECNWSHLCDSIALVSSRFAFNIENLNLALTSDLLHDTRRRYNDK